MGILVFIFRHFYARKNGRIGTASDSLYRLGEYISQTFNEGFQSEKVIMMSEKRVDQSTPELFLIPICHFKPKITVPYSIVMYVGPGKTVNAQARLSIYL